MEQKEFQKLITNITVVLHNYLVLAKQSGRITLVLDAEAGIPTQCVVANSLKLDLSKLKED